MENTPTDSTRNSYGWVIVGVATAALIISNGLTIGGFPPFYKSIREEFVAIGAIEQAHAETFIANGANIVFLMSGVFSLLGGWLLTRIRLKVLMLVGCVMLGGGLVLHSQANTAELVYLARFLMGASLGFVGVAPNVVLVSNWFSVGRGVALGIVLTGTSLGGSVVSLLAGPLIANYGWRNAMFALSLLVWLVLLPAIILLVKERGTGESWSKAATAAAAAADSDGMTFVQAVKTPLFWVFAACAALVFYPIFVTLQQFILYVQTPKIGISAESAAFGQSALFAISVGGKFLAGFLSDKFRAVRVMAFFAFLMFLSSLVLLDLTARNALLFLLPFALGYGGTWVLLQRLSADFFGKREIGKILGAITLIEVVGATIGGRITGYLADQAGGDYTNAFYGVTIVAGLAFVSTLVIVGLDKRRKAVQTA
ncbi:MAG TPA: MFS transporter [Pyrinomonadaceae bacterium]|nr:MFS transporter [Pyrinomonadaceae bacterium]